MNTKNIYWIIAGILNLLTALLHLIGGQLTIVNPMMESSMPFLASSEMLGAWHMVTAMLFISSYHLLRIGFGGIQEHKVGIIKLIGQLYIAFGLAFIVANLMQQVFTPQWILLIPIGILALIGLKKRTSNA